MYREGAWRRAWRDTGEAIGAVFWVADGVLALVGAYAGAKVGGDSGSAFIGGVLGLVALFLVVFSALWITAPVRQRNDARDRIHELELAAAQRSEDVDRAAQAEKARAEAELREAIRQCRADMQYLRDNPQGGLSGLSQSQPHGVIAREPGVEYEKLFDTLDVAYRAVRQLQDHWVRMDRWRHDGLPHERQTPEPPNVEPALRAQIAEAVAVAEPMLEELRERVG